MFNLSLKNKYEVIIATSNPPIVGPFSAAVISLLINSRFIYYCMDITPEVGLISGDFRNPFLFKFLQNIDNLSCFCKTFLVHSKDMKETLLKKNWQRFHLKF